MELVRFTHKDGRTENLRPTHALLIAGRLGSELKRSGSGFTVHAGSLAEAARQVREGYRCRTVRKELRRIGLLGVDGVADRSEIGIECDDAQVVTEMLKAAA